MSVGYRDESDTQLVGHDHGPEGGTDVTATRAASLKTTIALRAE
jgi:hypothetical protein